MIDPKTLAASTLQLLQADPSKYRLYGMYWYLIKALMKRFYTVENLYLLGDYEDPTVIDRMPPHANLQEALAAAVEEYRQNASFGMGSTVVTDDDGEAFTLVDQDAGL